MKLQSKKIVAVSITALMALGLVCNIPYNIKAADTTVPMKSVEINNVTCYYAVGSEDSVFTANGKTVDAEQISSTDVYYYVENNTLSGKLYGTSTLSYSDYYAGETSVTEYDAVSSATTGKSTTFPNGDATVTQAGIGYQILGVKNVPVAVDAKIYGEAVMLKEAGRLPDSGIYVMASEIVLNENATEETTQYKELTESGYTARTTRDITITDAKASLKTTSTWGDYEIDVIENSTKYLRNSRDDDFAVNSQIQGMILEATDGTKVGMRHMKEIWVQPYEVSFDIDSPAGQQLIGKTINKITYLMPESSYVYEFAEGIYVKPQIPESSSFSAEFTENLKAITVDISNLPADLKSPKVTVYIKEGRNTTYYVQNAEIVEGRVLLTTPGGIGTENQTTTEQDSAAKYTVLVSSDNYADKQITIEGGSPSDDDNATSVKPSLKFSKSVTTMKKGAQSVFRVKVEGISASDITWKSSKTSVATVKKEGKYKATVTANKVGTTVITVKAGTEKVKVKVKVTKKVSRTKAAAKKVKYKNGTYTGTAKGFEDGDVTVTVKIKKGVIKKITATPGYDTEPYFTDASALTKKIIKKQKTTGIDVVAGATYSSYGILEAVQDALNQAKK